MPAIALSSLATLVLLTGATFAITPGSVAPTTVAAAARPAPAAPPATQDALLDQARSLRRAQRLDEAIGLLRDARAERPDDPELEGLLGSLLIEQGHENEARALASGLAGRAAGSYRAQLLLGQVAALSGDQEGALRAFRKATGLKTRPIDALAGQVRALLALGKPGQAAKRGRELNQLHPDTGRPLLSAALVAQAHQIMRQGIELYGVAAERLRQALQLQPDDRDTLELLLEVLVLTLRLDEAAELARSAYAAPEDQGQMHYWLGRCQEAGRDVQAARREYRAALELQPDAGRIALRMARLDLGDGLTESARGWLERARANLGDSPRTLTLLAEVHLGLGELKLAEATLRRVTNLDPRDAGAAYQLARVLYQQGDREQGKHWMERFEQLQKQNQAESEGDR